MRSARPSRKISVAGGTCAKYWRPGPAREGGTVEKLGDALIRLRTQVSTLRVATGGSLNADPPADPPPTCPKCLDRGFLRRNVEAGHPDFGQVMVCPCRRREVAERKQNRLERMSNLG